MPFEPGGRFGMAAAYRVAAPSIRIVPWAALASCWPLPQQLLPVSAAGGGRRRCTLGINSGKSIFYLQFRNACGRFGTAFLWGEAYPPRIVILPIILRHFLAGAARKSALFP